MTTPLEQRSSCHVGCKYVDFAYEKMADYKLLHHKKCEENEKLTYTNSSLRKDNTGLRKERNEYKVKADKYDNVMARLQEMERICEEQAALIKVQEARIKQLEKDEDDSFKWRKEDRARISDLKTQLESANEEKASLSAEVEVLREEKKSCLNEIARLKSILNNNPSNTSIPPSQGQAGLDPHSHRPKSQNEYNDRDAAKKKEGEDTSKKKKGGQKNHRGTTLTKEEIEKFLEENRDKCRHEIHEFGTKVEGRPYRVKYVIGTETRVVIKEYRYYDDAEIPAQHYSDVTYDSSLKALAAYLYGEGNMATDKIKEFFSVLSNGLINVSEGSAYNFCRDVATRADESITQLRTDLLNSDVLYTDATNTKEDGKQSYVRNTSNENTVVYSPQDSKTIEEIGNNSVLKSYVGTIMADHELAIKHFGIQWAECNQHTGRYCHKNEEQTNHTWMIEFMDLLYEMKDSKASLQEKGINAFSEDVMEDYSKRYDSILAKGWKENSEDKKLWKYADDDEKALLRRLEKYKDDHIRFATNFKVDFSNNRSEGDVRFIKNRTKLSGGFRQKSGRQMCCDIMSIVRTCKKRKMPIFSTLVAIAETGKNVFQVLA